MVSEQAGTSAAILVCPADRLSAVKKSLTLPVRQVVFDLEDAVSDEHKTEARDSLIQFLASGSVNEGPGLAIRVNEVNTKQGIEDVIALSQTEFTKLGLTLVIPKLETTATASTLKTLLDSFDPLCRVTTQIIVESSLAFVHLAEIIDILGPRISGLIFGPGDYLRDLNVPNLTVGVSNNEQVKELLAHGFRSMLIQARAAHLQCIDGPVGTFGSPEAEQNLREATGRAVRLGADAKWVIHPSQIAIVNEGFLPPVASIVEARDTWEAYDRAVQEGKGAVSHNGNMIDKANAEAAFSFYQEWKHLLHELPTIK